MRDSIEQPQRHKGDGCHCPDYITYCVHVDGVGVFWILSREDAGREFTRRMGLPAIAGILCPRCATPVSNPLEAFVVYGPGQPSTPRCVCYVELNIQSIEGIRKADTLEDAFSLVSQALP